MVHSTDTEAPFPELLRHKRVQAGLTQRTLADLSTISPRTIRDLESGRAHARMQTVRLLADALRLNGLARDLFISSGSGGRCGEPDGTDPGLAAPRAVNALLGRDTEVRAMAQALESGHRRVVSVSGLPGVGKSRVAAELAARLGSRRGWPVLWIGTGPQPHGAGGTAFGPLTKSLRLLVDSGAADVSAVCRLIGRHEALLVLDGVADTGPPAGVEELLAYCPGIRVVSTSRTPWQVAGVQATVLPPLAVPGAERDATGSPDALAGVPSVRLLLDRLSEVRPGFVPGRADADALARVCRRLDGLPVALEAAAGRFGVLGLRHLAEEPLPSLLDLPVPARSAGAPRTIGCLLGGEVDRLDAAHRAILLELARCDRAPTVPEAAAALDLPRNDLVDGVGQLLGRGLVRASHEESGTRLHLPNLLRALLRAPRNPRGSL
ncbi:helix-turn-helix domain-containing protein [Kitasatospora sp. NPDC058190]|uniref:helix-turn-helix domain-containing protein n=1 Tax=Kitasatospora sp. NPDC058190 TaxID=3346371 RepID=UPI0036D83D11